MTGSDPSAAFEGTSLEATPDPDLIQRTFAEVAGHTQIAALPTPIQNPPLLPLAALEPEVLERVAAELVHRQDNLGAQFYGRRGQKQLGLDIVERETDRRRSLYQVKRFGTLTAKKLRDAVTEYAGAARPGDYEGPKRSFDPRRFVIVTSAELDSDTKNVDELATLQDEYAGDLDVAVWGAETLSRKLRDAPHIVHAVFGPAWAKAFCSFDPAPPDPAAPKSLGLVEGPLAVLHLDALEADAASLETSDPAEAARLFGILARGLDDGGFPSHAAVMRRRQAVSTLGAGDHQGHAKILFELALSRLLSGEVMYPSQIHDLNSNLTSLDAPLQAKQSVLVSLAGWYEHGSNLSVVVPPLRGLADAKDPHAALLCCLALEQALVDGIYDFEPTFSTMAHIEEGSWDLAVALRDLAAVSETSDVLIRARLRCAVADATLLADADSGAIENVYGDLISEALAGRFLQARGLIASRAAYAFATRGDIPRAENLWRQSILGSSEDEHYGDTRNAIRALRLLAFEGGQFGPADRDIAASSLPNRQRLLAGSHDPELAALEAAHNDKLPEALGDARRYLWESRLSGHLQEEFLAEALLGDVFAAGGHPLEAVQTYVVAGRTEKAANLAAEQGELVDVTRWTQSALRRRRAAALQVIGAQAALVVDSDVPAVIEMLLHAAEGLWRSHSISPIPELEAIKAISKFGVRIPATAVDGILAIATPAVAQSTRVSDDVANLLVQSYWSVEERRTDIAKAVSQMLRLPVPPHQLWGLVQGMPAAARGPLLPEIRALADEGNMSAVAALASWREATGAVQVAARRACAALLRRLVGVERSVFTVGTQESATVDLLLALLDADELVAVEVDELGPDKARPAGGVFYQTSLVPPDELPDAAPDLSPEDSSAATLPADEPTAAQDGSVAAVGVASSAPDGAALVAAGSPVELAIAVAGHLTAMTEDHFDGAAPRTQAVSALRNLLARIPTIEAAQIAHRLAAVYEIPGLSEMDLFEIGSGSPLSRVQMNTGAGDLPGYALLASAEAFRAGRTPSDAVSTEDRAFVSKAAASAVALLRDERPNSRHLGALTCAAIATSADEFSWLARCLVFHGDARVRSYGAELMPANPELFAVLASDPSADVRAAVASRSAELPESVHRILLEDPHLSVRRQASKVGGTAQGSRIDDAADDAAGLSDEPA